MNSENDALKRTEELKNRLDVAYRSELRNIKYNEDRAKEFAQKATEAEQKALRIKDDYDEVSRKYEELQSIVAQQDEVLKYVSEMEEAYGFNVNEEQANKAPVEELSFEENKENSITEFQPNEEAKDREKPEEEITEEVKQAVALDNEYADKGFVLKDAPTVANAGENDARKSKATPLAIDNIEAIYRDSSGKSVSDENRKELKEANEPADSLKKILPISDEVVEIKEVVK